MQSVPANQTVPPNKAQTAGYYRMTVGRFEVTALLDGSHPFPADDLLLNISRADIDHLLFWNCQASPVEGFINTLLIDIEAKPISIDAGAGELYGRDGCMLVANMRATGYRPKQTEEVLLTHLHRENVGSLGAVTVHTESRA
jgi:glyoxylase-like metal-dependent hydrolase (beta-lactamase superfamily II)